MLKPGAGDEGIIAFGKSRRIMTARRGLVRWDREVLWKTYSKVV